MRLSREIPNEHRVIAPNGSFTDAWRKWAEEAGATLERLGNEASDLEEVSTSATLAQTITALNELIAALKRIAP